MENKFLNANGVVHLWNKIMDKFASKAEVAALASSVVEGYYYANKFYSDSGRTNVLSGEDGKIYIDISSGTLFRFDGSTYVQLTASGSSTGGNSGVAGNGILETVLNNDYTLTIKFTDGTSYTTTSIRGLQGEKGIQGERGKSVYDIAVDSGFDGDEVDFITSLKGETGSSGVYVGPGDMPEDCNVQIYTDGDVAKFPTKTSHLENDSNFISSDKLKEAMNYVTPEMYGATGNGVTCDADAFIDALMSGKKVVCDSTKTYYFSKPIDVRTLVKGHFDGNNANFVNFHIYININDDFNDWRDDYVTHRFTIENMVLGNSKSWSELLEGWETPCITSGSPMIIRNIITKSYPYIYAPVGLYIDVVQIEHWVSGINWSLFNNHDIELDTISYLNSNGEYKRFDGGAEKDSAGKPLNRSYGDGWKISQCQEFYSSLYPDYRFLCIGTKMPVVMEQCVQCNVKVFDHGHLTMIGCHYEGAKVEYESSENNGKITFLNTYFYSTNTLIDNENVIYQNCFFRCLEGTSSRPLAELTNNKSWYDLKCILINCTCPHGYMVDTRELKTFKSLPKKTYNPNLMGELNKSLSSCSLRTQPSWWGNNTFFPDLGKYHYDVYILTTSLENVALAHREFDISLNDSLNVDAFLVLDNIHCMARMVVLRQNPDGKLFKTEYFLNPSTCDITDDPIKLVFRDNGLFSSFKISYKDANDNDILIMPTVAAPWISVDSGPEMVINNKLFEANGVLVTSDDSVINLDECCGQTQVSKNAMDRITKEEFNAYVDIVPDYVKMEADRVADSVLAAQSNKTFTFAALTDIHYDNSGYTDGIKHACQAIRHIDQIVKLDAVAVLGDYTKDSLNISYDNAIANIKSVNSLFEKFRFINNIRQKGCNDIYPENIPLTNKLIQAHSNDVIWGDKLNGYFYKDFNDYKLRMICVNVNESGKIDENNKPTEDISCTTSQYLWFAESLKLTDKEDAEEWQILILSHQPLDWYYEDNSYTFVKILNAYKSGIRGEINGVTYDFVEKNSAKIIGNIHGHIHNLLTGYLNDGNVDTNVNTTSVIRVSTPEACIDDESTAPNHSSYWKEEETYAKSVNTKNDTSFVVYCVDLEKCVINAFCYGAGYDRCIDYNSGSATTIYNITNNLTYVSNDNKSSVIGAGEKYDALLQKASVGEIESVKVTMGGIDITNEVYSNGIITIESVTGDIVITAVALPYINLIPLSIDSNGELYNGGLGYKDETMINGSGNEVSATNIGVTGFIPIQHEDTIYLKNVRFTPGGTNNCFIGLYNKNFERIAEGYCFKETFFFDRDYIVNINEYTTDPETGYLTSVQFIPGPANLPEGSYLRICATGLHDGTAVISKEPIR